MLEWGRSGKLDWLVRVVGGLPVQWVGGWSSGRWAGDAREGVWVGKGQAKGEGREEGRYGSQGKEGEARQHGGGNGGVCQSLSAGIPPPPLLVVSRSTRPAVSLAAASISTHARWIIHTNRDTPLSQQKAILKPAALS